MQIAKQKLKKGDWTNIKDKSLKSTMTEPRTL